MPRVRARLSAGGGSLETEGNVTGFYSFQRNWLLSRTSDPDACLLLEVTGDSMEPELRDGDLALVDQSQNDPLPGRIYAVGVEDMVYCKYVDREPGKLILRSASELVRPIEVLGELAEGVRVVGRVIWVGREM